MGIIASVLHKIKECAEQFNPIVIWKQVLSVIFARFLKGKILGEQEEADRDGVLQRLIGWLSPMRPVLP